MPKIERGVFKHEGQRLPKIDRGCFVQIRIIKENG